VMDEATKQDLEDTAAYLSEIPNLWTKTKQAWIEKVRNGQYSPADIEAIVDGVKQSCRTGVPGRLMTQMLKPEHAHRARKWCPPAGTLSSRECARKARGVPNLPLDAQDVVRKLTEGPE